MSNIILNTDSYKPSHWLQYPPKTTRIKSYIEARGFGMPQKAQIDVTEFAGIWPFIYDVMMKPFTMEDILEAEEVLKAHGEPFNKEGWVSMLNKYKGYLPVRIKAVPEGTVVPLKNALVTIENTDPEFYWATSYIETAILRAVWYATTVATISWAIREDILKAFDETSDDMSGVWFKLHDFGARGVSSEESAKLGGMAHLYNFMGSDTLSAVLGARKYYKAPMAAFSIPAAEHSSITSWGKENEEAAYRNMIKQFAKPGALFAVVSDSYDIYNAVYNIWGDKLKQEVIDSGATLVVRPDSGDPATVVVNVIEALMSRFGYTTNSKGYRVLPNCVRVIQGDGINQDSIRAILANMKAANMAVDNIAFGMGGALLQQLNRDSFKFAMKACAAEIDGAWVEVSKDPITDSGKKSKAGDVELVINPNGHGFETASKENPVYQYPSAMQVVYENGQVFNETTFEAIRERSKRYSAYYGKF